MPTAVVHGLFTGTAYGPPWNALEGGGTTAGGTRLTPRPTSDPRAQKYIVAADPSVLPLGTKIKAWPNPFGDPNLVFTVDDTGGAIKGNRLDFFIASGRAKQNAFGVRSRIRVTKVSGPATPPGSTSVPVTGATENVAGAGGGGDFFGTITKPGFWARIGKLVGGAVLVSMGAKALYDSTLPTPR